VRQALPALEAHQEKPIATQKQPCATNKALCALQRLQTLQQLKPPRLNELCHIQPPAKEYQLKRKHPQSPNIIAESLAIARQLQRN
jgi:hypothetical protein